MQNGRSGIDMTDTVEYGVMLNRGRISIVRRFYARDSCILQLEYITRLITFIGKKRYSSFPGFLVCKTQKVNSLNDLFYIIDTAPFHQPSVSIALHIFLRKIRTASRINLHTHLIKISLQRLESHEYPEPRKFRNVRLTKSSLENSRPTFTGSRERGVAPQSARQPRK